MLPGPSGKEKKDGYFSGVLKSLKTLNKYISTAKKSQSTPQQRAMQKEEDLAFDDFNAQLKQIRKE